MQYQHLPAQIWCFYRSNFSKHKRVDFSKFIRAVICKRKKLLGIKEILSFIIWS